MNLELAEFFGRHYAPGRIALVGATDLIGTLIRNGQAGLTPDGKPSWWSHAFLLGERRDDGRSDGSIYIYESDLKLSVADWQVQNGVMESRLAKWCRDDIEYACVMGMALTASERDRLLRDALQYAYDEKRLRYPVGELFGTLWAILTRRLSKRNIFDDRQAVQCSTFVRMCYRGIGRDLLDETVDLTHTNPEALYRSAALDFREEWHRA
ncbi:MAG: hypothetical protein GTO22_07520 [Gemmatimonadales bacterium]|nr:hypothetical protein [Gemmatimonadales bacterium]